MLVELGLVEQRHAAVLEVLRDGASVSDVALRFGVARQTVHRWLLHHAHVVMTAGDSIRLTQATAGKGVTPLTN